VALSRTGAGRLRRVDGASRGIGRSARLANWRSSHLVAAEDPNEHWYRPGVSGRVGPSRIAFGADARPPEDETAERALLTQLLSSVLAEE
jgi:hypothetical protein